MRALKTPSPPPKRFPGFLRDLGIVPGHIHTGIGISIHFRISLVYVNPYKRKSL